MSESPTVIALTYQDSATIFQKLAKLPNRVWLDSHQSPGQRWDILSAAPVTILENPSAHSVEQHVENLSEEYDLDALKHLPFTGGAIGYFNYEHRHPHFGLAASSENQTSSRWGIFDWAILVDHSKQSCLAVFLPNYSQTAIDQRLHLLKALPPPAIPFYVGDFKAELSREHYAEAFMRIQDYIQAGDCYQINFAQRFIATFDGDSSNAYLALRQALPSPYCAFIDLGAGNILSFSPEQFIEIEGNRAQTKPIKGTIRRGSSAEEDEHLKKVLKESIKNQAENLMIVDLLRNDFSQSCEPWSVKVPELFTLESYANVHHLVSTITGNIKPNISPLTFFERCFPGGSITGAPKKRAMQIIHKLEQKNRNIYCGSIAFLSTNNRFNSNIAIRTLMIHEGEICCWGGGGIVSDSIEEEEYAESQQKIRVLLDALKH